MRFSQSLYRFLFPLYGKELKKLNSCEGNRDGNQGEEIIREQNADIAAAPCIYFTTTLINL